MKPKKLAMSVAAVAVFATGMVTIEATAASANITGCSGWNKLGVGGYVRVYCNGGGGSRFMAIARCKKRSNGEIYDRYGNWYFAGQGQTSVAVCYTGDYLLSGSSKID